MYTKLIIRFQGLWNKRRKRYRNNNVHALRALHMPLIYMYKCTWVEHNITFIWAAISRSVTPSSFYLFENKNVSNLDTNLINEASSLSVTGNLCPWNSFFSDKTKQLSIILFLLYTQFVNWDSNWKCYYTSWTVCIYSSTMIW